MAKQVNKSIIVKGDIKDVFDLWADFENFPKFMSPIKQVKKTGDRISHWLVEGPAGKTLQWDAETTTFEENKRIAWNSIGGDIQTTGQVTFAQLPKDQTQVNVTLQYVHGDGLLNELAAKVFGNVEEQLADSLRRFKAIAENGD